MRVTEAIVQLPNNFPNIGFGIDPGVNWGLSVVYPLGKAFIYWGSLPKARSSTYRGLMARNLIKKWQIIADILEIASNPIRVVIEGAAYKKRYWQVQLAEIRFGFALGFLELNLNPVYAAPSSVRKAVFGHGNTKAHDIWLGIKGDAADSLAIAMYAASALEFD
jgi:Holliday junction resolvasome RuvABC endonuclease subunit